MKKIDRKKAIFVDSSQEIQIKDLVEKEHIEGIGEVEVTKKVFLHTVTHIDKDINDICKKYKVTLE